MAYTLNTEGNYFSQDTLAEVHEWLTCTGVGAVDIPEGDRTPFYCPDPANSGQFKIEGYIIGDKGAGTYTLTKPLVGVYNYLLEVLCEHNGRINYVCGGNRQDRTNYEFAVLLFPAFPSGRGITDAVRAPDTAESRVNSTLNINFTNFMLLYPLITSRQAVINTAHGNTVTFLPARCKTRCSDARGLCQVGIIGCDRDVGYLYDAEIKKTINGGASWAATAVDPYTWGGNTGEIILFDTATAWRILAFRSAEIVGAPAECAVSDDEGVTWANRVVSTLNNQAVFAAAKRGAYVYGCGSDGYIWRSTTQGDTWTTVEAGIETNEDLNDIIFDLDGNGYCVGNANEFLYVTETSEDWATRAGPPGVNNLLSVAVNLEGDVFVGTNDGRIFRSTNEGQAWTEWVDLAVGTIPWIEFEENGLYVGGFIHNTAAPVGSVYRSEDGGASWRQVPNFPMNAGLNDGHMCDQNHIVVVGNDYLGTTFIAMLSPG